LREASRADRTAVTIGDPHVPGRSTQLVDREIRTVDMIGALVAFDSHAGNARENCHPTRPCPPVRRR
jgi:hypothetical protein